MDRSLTRKKLHWKVHPDKVSFSCSKRRKVILDVIWRSYQTWPTLHLTSLFRHSAHLFMSLKRMTLMRSLNDSQSQSNLFLQITPSTFNHCINNPQRWIKRYKNGPKAFNLTWQKSPSGEDLAWNLMTFRCFSADQVNKFIK